MTSICFGDIPGSCADLWFLTRVRLKIQVYIPAWVLLQKGEKSKTSDAPALGAAAGMG